jgi:hypothetical protein
MVIPNGLVGGYQHFGGMYYLHLQEEYTHTVSIFRVEAIKMETVYFSAMLASADDSTCYQTPEENQQRIEDVLRTKCLGEYLDLRDEVPESLKLHNEDIHNLYT